MRSVRPRRLRGETFHDLVHAGAGAATGPARLGVGETFHDLVHAGAGAALQLFYRAGAVRAEIMPHQTTVAVVRLAPDEPPPPQPGDDAGEGGGGGLRAVAQRPGRGAFFRP